MLVCGLANAQTWQPLGPNDIGLSQASFGRADYTSMAISPDGTPYVVFQDSENNGKATVRKFNGSSWETVGIAGFSENQALYSSIAFSLDGTPYVGYQDGAMDKATVKKYNGSTWETVGIPHFSTGPWAYFTSIAISPNGTPYVAYQEYNDTRNKASVMKFNGTSWEIVGSAGFSAGQAPYTSLAISSGGTPFVAYMDGGNGDKATVMKFNGSNWEAVGNAGFSAGLAYYTSITLDAGDTPYVIYQDNQNGKKATVKKFNGSSWETVGSEGFSAGQAWFTSIDIHSDGIPYAVYSDYGNDTKATVMKYNGSSWEMVGSSGFSTGQAWYTSIAIDAGGTPFVACRDNGNGNKATVMKFNGSSWEILGIDKWGFSEAPASYTSIAMSPGGSLYVVYQDHGNNGKATVKKYNGTSWEVVGSAGFSPGQALYTSIAIDVNGTPYVAFQGSKGMVMKFNGSSWETLGAEFSFFPLRSLSMAISPDGTVYVLYNENLMANYGIVKKFNGSSWEKVGSTSNFSPSFPTLDRNNYITINSSGTPYVVCGGSGSLLMVKKFTGSSWEDVGSGGISAGWADYASIVLNSDGTPYIAYRDRANGYKATVKKFNGDSWETVGIQGFSAGQANYTTIAINGNGTPYIVYRDYVNSYKATVMKFNGSSWETVGSAEFSGSPVDHTSLAINDGGTLYVAYGNGGAWGYKYGNDCINPTRGGTITGNQNGCEGFDPEILASSSLPNGNAGNLEYKWQKSTTGSSSGFSDIANSNAETYDPDILTQTTWYKRIARVDCMSNWISAAESNVLTVTVNPTPTVEINNPAAVCSPQTVNLSAAAITAGSTEGLTFTYWTDAEATASYPAYATTTTAGNYYIKGTTAEGCSAIEAVIVTVNPTPTEPIIGEIIQPTCFTETGSVELTGLPEGNWVINPGTITGAGLSITISDLIAGTYNYTVTNADGCLSVASGNVVINEYPILTVTASSGIIATNGGTTILTADATGGKLPYNYNLNGGTFQSSNTFTVSAGTYIVLVQDANGCTATSNTVTVTQPPVKSTTTLSYKGTKQEQYYSQASLSAVLRDAQTGNGISNETISFTVGTQTLTATTDGMGQAYVTLLIDQVPGNYHIVSVFEGNEIYQGSSDDDLFTINQRPVTAELTGIVTKVYDGTKEATIAADNYILTGIVNSDMVFLNNPTNGTYNNKNIGTGKNITVRELALTGADADKYSLTKTTVTAKIGVITSTYKLASIVQDVQTIGSAEIRAYPNPFTEKLNVDFSSPVDTYARLEIFSITGSKLETLFDNPIEGGQLYHTEYLPQIMSSQILFYRLTLGDHSYVGKLIFQEKR